MKYDGIFRNEAEVFEFFRREASRKREDGTMAVIAPEFIKNLQGRDFVLYGGLLDAAHKEGLIKIKTKVEQVPTEENGLYAVVSATAYKKKRTKDKDGQFTENLIDLEYDGIGDASPESVGRNIKPHILRMAETRAKARALRDMINVGMAAVEELGPDMDEG